MIFREFFPIKTKTDSKMKSISETISELVNWPRSPFEKARGPVLNCM